MFSLGRTLRRQRLEHEALRAELRRSEHLAALGKLLAGVAHEIRNPLAGIRSTIQLWQRLPEKSQTTGSMEAVIHAADRLNDIVTRLLYFSRSDSNERQTVQVNDILKDTFALLAAQAERQIVSLELDLAADLPPVPASPSGLRQVSSIWRPTPSRRCRTVGGCVASLKPVRITALKSCFPTPEAASIVKFVLIYSSRSYDAPRKARAWVWRSAARSFCNTTARSNLSAERMKGQFSG